MNGCRLVGCNHVTAPLSVREHIAFGKDNLVAGIKSFLALQGVREAMIFSTCNRTEIYYCGEIAEAKIIAWLSDFHHIDSEWLRSCLYMYEDLAALSHLARVAAGLDSIALGEPQVLGQLKEAYRVAKQQQAIHDALDKDLQFIFNLAKKLRSSTNIGKQSISLAAATVNLAQGTFPDLARCSALIVGAGPNAHLLAEYLSKKQIKRLYIANRTYQAAEALAAQQKGATETVPLMDLEAVIPDVDLIFTSTTGPTILIGKGMVENAMRLRGNKRMFIADMSVPRDLESSVGELPQVSLYTLDDIQRVLMVNIQARRKEIAPAQDIIDQALEQYLTQHSPYKEILASYRLQVQQWKEVELAKALRAIKDESARRAATLLADRLAAKISHDPTQMIRTSQRKRDYKQLRHLAEGLLKTQNTNKHSDDV